MGQDVECIMSNSQRAETQRRAGRASPPCSVPLKMTVVRRVTLGTAFNLKYLVTSIVQQAEFTVRVEDPLLIMTITSLLDQELSRKAV